MGMSTSRSSTATSSESSRSTVSSRSRSTAVCSSSASGSGIPVLWLIQSGSGSTYLFVSPTPGVFPAETVTSGMETRAGRFRVYRVVESVHHINLFDAEATRLYTTYQSGYGDRQADIDALRTGDLVE